MLHPRAAAKWLLSRPKRRDLVPPGLKAFLERTERPGEREVPALGPVEHERLLAQSRAAATFDPRARRNTVLGLIRASLSSRTCTVAEILAVAYGDPQGSDYWDAWLFEPLPVYTFADLLSVHRAADAGAPSVSVNGVPMSVLDGYQR